MGNQHNKKRVSKRMRAEKIKKMIKAMNEAREMRKAGLVPPFKSGISKIKHENAAENENKELCKKIRDSLKQLRQSDTCEEETVKSGEIHLNPSLSNLKTELFIEVFPHNSGNLNNAEENAATDKVIKEEPPEFYDESETPELLVEIDNKTATPVKRNLRRKAKEIKKDQQHAKLEGIFVSTIKKPKKINKRSHLETSKMLMHFEHTEQLYDYGKYVAEQMMSFDEKDVYLAQAEINEVLAKFRLKYKITKCLSKPHAQLTSSINSKQQNMTKYASQVKSNRQNISRFASQANENGQLVVKSLPTESMSLSEEISKIDSSSLATPLGFVIEPLSIPGGFHISTQRIDSTGSIVSQPVTLQGIVRTSETELESSEIISNGATLNQQISPNISTHSTALISNTITNGTLTSGMSITNSELSCALSDGISVTQPGSSQDTIISERILAPEPGSSQALSNTASMTASGSSNALSNRTSMTEPGSSHDTIITEKILVPELESSLALSNRTSVPEPGSSHDTIMSEKILVTDSSRNTIVSEKILVVEPGSSQALSSSTPAVAESI